MAEDDTQELLRRYGSTGYKDSVGFNDEDISLYSEDSIFKENFAQLRMSSPLKKQTPRKTLFTPRLPKTSTYSPAKERNFHESNNKSPLRNNMNSVSDMSMNQDLQNFIGKSVLDFAIKEDDKTELLIEETHKAINSIPKSVLGNKDIDDYQKLISNSIEKLAAKCEALSVENESLKNNDDKVIIQQLQHKINALNKTNDMYKQEVTKQSDEFMRMLNENNDLKRENELLRTKLVKYKNLYEAKERVREKVDIRFETTKPPRQKESQKQPKKANKLIQLYNEMAEILEKEKKRSGAQIIQDKEEEQNDEEGEVTTNLEFESEKLKSDLLKQFENIVREKTTHTINNPQTENGYEEDINKILLNNNKLYEKLINVLEFKQKHETIESERSPAHKEESKEKQDVVLKCYLCCQKLHTSHESSNESKPESQPTSSGSNDVNQRRKCERCTNISSKSSKHNHNYNNIEHIQRNTSGFGIDLMGEYKWTI